MMKARYTQSVSKWHVRAVTFLTVATIAGGPTVSMICDALCADHGLPRTAVPTANPSAENASHHHESSAHAADSHMREAAAGDAQADHLAAAASTNETLPDSHTLLIRPSGDCCSNLGTEWASVVAARPDKDVRSTTQVAVSLDVPPFNLTDRQPRTWTHAPPPGEWSQARTPLVLRV
jgi:hypothetical protein